MQNGPTQSRYFDLETHTWSVWMDRTEAATQEHAMFQRLQTGAKVELLTSRCHTMKPSSDRRFREKRETASADNTRSQIAVS